MSKRKKLWRVRRILAMALAVAIMVTSLPVTALAAPGEIQTGQETEEVSDQKSDESSVSTEETPAEPETDEEAGTPNENDGETDTETEEPSGKEEGTESVPPSETEDGTETVTPDESEKDGEEDVENPDAEAPAEDDVDEEESEKLPTDVMADPEQKADPKYEFDVEEYSFSNVEKYNQGMTKFATESEVDGKKTMTVNWNILYAIYLKSKNESLNLYYDSEDEIVKTVTYAWLKEDGTPLGEGIAPKDAGSYKLSVKLPAKAGVCQEAETTLDFTIEKADVEVSFANGVNVKPGTLKKDVKKPDAYVSASDGASMKYDQQDQNQNDIALTFEIKKADTDEAVGDEEKILKDQDYVAAMKAEFVGANKAKYEANYEINCETVQVTLEDLRETAVRLTVDGEYGKTYNATEYTNAYDETQKITKITIPYAAGKSSAGINDLDGKLAKKAVEIVRSVNEQGEETAADQEIKDVAGTDWECAWYGDVSFDGVTSEDGKSHTYTNMYYYSKLTEAPKNAGTYVYEVKYTGDKAVYAEAAAAIVVEIGTTELVIRPKLGAEQFYSGQTAEDVLAQVKPEILNAKDESAFTIPADLSDRFWGTSYYDTGKTQPYEPTFQVWKVTKGADGTIVEETALGFSERLSYTLPAESTDKVHFEVRFTGRKAVYSASGVTSSIDINEQAGTMDTSYAVKTDGETLAKYAAVLNVAEGDKAEIDETDIISGFETKKLGQIDASAKIYDGSGLFANRSNYKKAKLKDGKSSNAITDYVYTWYWNSMYTTVEEATETTTDGTTTTVVLKENFENYFRTQSFISPTDAGIYKLQIAYKDPAGKVVAAPKSVYFVIEKQELVLDLKTKSFEEFSGVTVDQFVNDQDIEYTVTPGKDKPSKAEDWKNGNEIFGDDWYDYMYDPGVEVQRLKLGEDGKPLDKAKDENWEPVSGYEAFTADSEYRLSVAESYSSVYGYKGDNFKIVAGKTRNEIKVTAMGTKQLAVVKADGKTPWEEVTVSAEYNAKSMLDNTEIKSVLESFNTAKLAVRKEDGSYEPISDVKLKYDVEYNTFDGESSTADVFEGALPLDAESWPYKAVNAGSYVISVSFRGDANYASMNHINLGIIGINQKQLKINAPALTVEAGAEYSSVAYEAYKAFNETDQADVEGYCPEDAAYFKKELNEDHCSAWTDDCPTFSIYKGAQEYYGQLTDVGDGTYTLKYDVDGIGTLDGWCWNNYTCVAGKSAPITVTKASARVQATSASGVAQTTIADRITNDAGNLYKHTVVTTSAVPFNNYKGENGNWVAVRITAPAVYNEISGAVYEKAIEKAGGVIDYASGYSNWIRVVFNAAKQKDADFNIRWSDGDIERFVFKFSESECLGDLRNAVAPKSMAFNAPPKTLVVGQSAQLDVKITKEQHADVICLGYEVDNNEHGQVLHVDEYGNVTALKEGKGTITAYPMKLVDGKKVKIDDTKVKTSVTITVKKVTAPKIMKTTMTDQRIDVQYSLVNASDGYRREVYVMEGKNLPAQTFEDAIKSMKNGKWQGTFAAAPQFISYSEERDREYNGVWDDKKKAYVAVRCSFYGLTSGEEYTVYVRNVNAARTLSDGCQVATGEAAGSVKSVKMTKPQVLAFDLSLQEGTYTEFDEELGMYTVSLTEDKPQINLEGAFPDLDSAAENNNYRDWKWYSLPFKDADAKKNYEAPKYSYYFYEYIPAGGYDAFKNYYEEGDFGYVTSCSRATITKSGKITLKQPGEIDVVALDANNGVEGSLSTIWIVAEADGMKAKNATLSVGQRIKLENLVTYTHKGKVLDPTCYPADNRIDRTAVAQALKDNASFKLSDNGYITAYAGKDTVKLTLKDKFIEGASVEVTLKSVDLAPVKGLTVTDVVDNKARVQFEVNPYASAYRIKLYDQSSRKTLLKSVYLSAGNTGSAWYVTDNGEPSTSKKFRQYRNYEISGLTQQSKYNVTVTALFDRAPSNVSEYEGVESKEVAKAFVTTKIPASYYNLSKEDMNQGLNIQIRENGSTIDYERFVSGNAYTLVSYGHNKGAQYAATDTLIWTSSNPKVASVKANNGGYSAALKTVSAGRTVIEVQSKLTKKVVARYQIYVYPVKDAYRNEEFYGDNENLHDFY